MAFSGLCHNADSPWLLYQNSTLLRTLISKQRRVRSPFRPCSSTACTLGPVVALDDSNDLLDLVEQVRELRDALLLAEANRALEIAAAHPAHLVLTVVSGLKLPQLAVA